MPLIHIAAHVHARTDEHGNVVVLDTATGRWHVLNGTAAAFWCSWQAGHDLDSSAAAVAERFGVTEREQIRADAGRLVGELARRGMVTVGQARAARRPPDRALKVASAPAGSAGEGAARVLSVQAVACLLLAVALLRLPFRAVCGVVRAVRYPARMRPTGEQAAAFLAVVDRVASRYPGRAACLERSLAVVLLAAVHARRLDWCLGAVADPYRFHAWVECAGSPVVTPAEEHPPGLLRVLCL